MVGVDGMGLVHYIRQVRVHLRSSSMTMVVLPTSGLPVRMFEPIRTNLKLSVATDFLLEEHALTVVLGLQVQLVHLVPSGFLREARRFTQCKCTSLLV